MADKILTVNDIFGELKGKINFEHLRKRTKEIRQRIGKSMDERRERLRLNIKLF